MIRARRARIVATLGPASREASKVIELATAGADVFRVNFSHGTHADHAATIANVRAAEAAVGRPLAVLADLQGPKIRLGEFADRTVRLKPGQDFRLDTSHEPGDASRVGVPLVEVFAALAPRLRHPAGRRPGAVEGPALRPRLRRDGGDLRRPAL